MKAHELLREGRTIEAIDVLLQFVENQENQEFFDDLILLRGGFKRTEREFSMNLVANDERNLIINRISKGTLDIANCLTNYLTGDRLQVETKETIKTLKTKNDEIISKELNMIKDILKKTIPNFDSKFPENLHDSVFDEIRASMVFKEHQSRALIIGTTNTGKTTTLNYILGAEVFPENQELALTKSVLCGQHNNGLIFYDTPGLDENDIHDNIVRNLLKLPEIPDSPIDEIRLIDYTENKKEAKELTHRVLKQEDYLTEITDLSVLDRLEARQLDKKVFCDWLYERIDFLIFILTPEEGLRTRVQNLLAKIENDNSKKYKIFKIINIKTGENQVNQYNSDLQEVRRRFATVNQAITRLKEMAVVNAEEWFCVDSKKGLGFENLFKSMADSLPPDVLHNLNANIKSRYSNLIQNSLNERYKEFVIEIACIVGTYPVDSEIEGIDILEFAHQSIIFIAEYVYSLRNGELNEASELLSEKLSILKQKRYKKKSYNRPVKKTKEVSKTVVKTITHANPFKNVLHDILAHFEVVDPRTQPVLETETIEYVENKREYYYSYSVGSIHGIELILSIGKSIVSFANAKSNNFSSDYLSKNVVTIDDTYDIQRCIKIASSSEYKRNEMISEIKPLLKKYI